MSHRALILAAMGSGMSRLGGLSKGHDVRSTSTCLACLGAEIRSTDDLNGLLVQGWGSRGPTEPHQVLDCGNSGTTLRLLSGLLAGSSGFFVLAGDESLSARPQARIIEPLNRMGGQVLGRQTGKFSPLAIQGRPLKGFSGELKVASAQVKSSLILASLAAGVELDLQEKAHTRDHTERMLRSLGVPLVSEGLGIRLPSGRHIWEGFEFQVPGDPSSAAFLVAAAVMGKDCKVRVEGLCLNPTRLGFFRILKRMGAEVRWETTEERMGEPVGYIEAQSSPLIATEVGPDEVPSAIDELPLLAVVATAAHGTTMLWGAEELRVKESDRIASVCRELTVLGAAIRETADGFSISGPSPLRGGEVGVHMDHRLEMSLAVAALVAEGETVIRDAGWASISFPEFWEVYPGQAEGAVTA